MRNLLRKLLAGNKEPASLIAALVLVALVPAVCVLWFMNVAMRNERLAVQERLANVYANHLVSLQQHMTAFVQERQVALQATGQRSPSEIFAAVVRAGLADSVVVCDAAGRVLYPTAATVAESAAENADLARALQAQAAKLLKAEQKEQALARLTELVGDARLRETSSAQGALIVPNAQLLILKTLATAEPSPKFAALRQQTLDDLIARLNDYTDAALPSNQRRFLMAEVKTLVSDANVFPTLAAEELAADYVEHDPTPPADAKLQRTPLAKIWRLPSADRTVVALLREERLCAEIARLLDPLALPDVRVTVLPPGEVLTTRMPVAPLDAGELLPSWRLALSFRDGDPLAEASTRQTHFYLWAGFSVVLIIAALALVVARYVAAQMRLARIKNELVSTVSHELKTPLASMRALVDTLAAGRFRDQQQLQDYLQLIGKENLRLSHLIDNFLTFSQLERGKRPFRFEELTPESVLTSAVDALKEKLAAPQCRFEQQVAPDLPHIRGDANALSTVMINLLDNAWKYTDGDKRISARAYAKGRCVCFEVEDNGIGIDSAEAKRVFDRFYQVDQSLTRRRGGCGLGLGIVQYIVWAHGGVVEVQSEPGHGSTFLVKIPLARPTP